MKAVFSLLIIFLSLFNGFSQESDKTMVWDGEIREYFEYIPSSYDGTKAIPLVLTLHGLGNSKESFRDRHHFYPVADTANFIVLTPEALETFILFKGDKTCWNAGVLGLNSGVDDTGFLNALLDKIITNYNIDLARIYVTGYSMGGYMTNKLACQLNGRFAAIASVSGTFGGNFDPSKYNVKSISTLHMHGTDDSTVPYANNSQGMDTEDLVEFWRDLNNCNNKGDTVLFNDADDGRSIEQITYANGDKCTETIFYKIINGDHGWPFIGPDDIEGANHIWDFFLKHKKYNTNSISQTACISYTSPNGTLHTQTKKFNDTIPSFCGRDSIITIDLTINNVNTSVTKSGNTLQAQTSNATYQWLDCHNNNQPITGEKGQYFSTNKPGSYAVSVTKNGCTEISSCTTISFVGINNHQTETTLTIYPNPAKDYFIVENKNTLSISIFSAQAQLIKEIKTTSEQTKINSSNFEKGVYFIVIYTKEGHATQRIVIE